MIVLWTLVVLVSLPAASQLSKELSTGGYSVPGSDSERARLLIERNVLGLGDAQQLYVVVPAHGASVRRSGIQAAAAIRRDARVRSVGPVRISPNGKTALVPFIFSGGFHSTERALPDLRERLEDVPGAEVTGQVAILDANNKIATHDFNAAERVALPITFAILLIAFLSATAAALPLALALVSLTVTYAALFGLTQVLEASVFVTTAALLFGLGLSIDYSLFLISRYRDELRRGSETDAAIEAAVVTAGRAVLFSGLTVSISVASLLVIGVGIFTAQAVAAALASLVATVSALTLLPALLSVLGPRINRFSLRRVSRAAERGTLWRRLAQLVLRRRVAVAIVVVSLLLVATIPVLGLRVAFPSTKTLLPTESNSVAAATHRVARDFGSGTLSPIQVITAADPQRVSATVAADPGVRNVLRPIRGSDRWTLISAVGHEESDAPGSTATLHRLRTDLAARFPDTFVGGQTAEGNDLADRMSGRFPLMVITVAVLTFLLLFAAFRSVVIPIKAIITNLLTVGAALGLLTLGFQSLGTSESIAFWIPPILFAVLFGLSMDYEVFLISRIRDAHLMGASNDASITEGLVRSGRPITFAALVMITVFAASAASELEPLRQFAIGTSIAVFLDATVARCLLVPATMAILGSRNWWAPRFLRRRVPEF